MMDINEEVYTLVREVLLDGVGHPVSELHNTLESVLGLRRTQVTSRIHRLVIEGKIENYKRGMYRLKDTPFQSVHSTNKLQWMFMIMKSLVNTARFSSADLISLSQADMAALQSLGKINELVENTLASYQNVER